MEPTFLSILASATLPLASPEEPPPNPFLIDSPFSAIHGGTYRQGFSKFPGPVPTDTLQVRTARTPANRVSPWLLYSGTYADGSRTVWGATSMHVFKAVSGPDRFEVISRYQLDSDPRIDDLSWSFLFIDEHEVLAYDDNRLFLLGEEDPDDPGSAIVLLDQATHPDETLTFSKLARLYDGMIAFASPDGRIGIIDPSSLDVVTIYQVPLAEGELFYHNDYAVDENGHLFFSTSERMGSVSWDGLTIAPHWDVPMDFGGNNRQRVGTTPTLLGSGPGDRLVCVVDSNRPARMLTFWRDAIPRNWNALPGFDRRVAAAVPLPGCRPPNRINAAVENSPVAYGYSIACAQYNGLRGQPCNTLKGVYKLTWNPRENTMALDWIRNDINLNNVLTLSTESGLLYGTGREIDCNYVFYGLCWETGKCLLRRRLGEDTVFDDPGNANIIGSDRSIIFNSKEQLVRIRPQSSL